MPPRRPHQGRAQGRGRLAGLLLAGVLAIPAHAADLLIAVAANFAAPAKALAERFERQTGHKLALSFGATGQFYAQIRHGAPFAALLAADEDTPAKLESEGLAVPGSRWTYATGRLVLWSASADLIKPQDDTLRSRPPGRLALANPKLSPYGRASLEVLAALGPAWAGPTVEAAHIGQAHQFVASGNAQLGFVALSLVQENGRLRQGSAWLVPQSLHKPIGQQAVILRAGQSQAAVHQFMRFMQSAPSRALIESYGYLP